MSINIMLSRSICALVGSKHFVGRHKLKVGMPATLCVYTSSFVLNFYRRLNIYV